MILWVASMVSVADEISFDPCNPFPSLPVGSYSYSAAKTHAEKVDHHLGFSCLAVERKLRPWISTDAVVPKPQETWQGLDVQSFQTPYVEIRSLLELMNLKPGQAVIDLGCAYGRMGHVIGKHFPENGLIGYELVAERVIEAQRILKNFSYPLVRIEARDLFEQPPEMASHYFIYDFGSQAAIRKILDDLREISRHQKIQVIARGKGARFLIHQSHAWLTDIEAPQHYEHFSIYRS